MSPPQLSEGPPAASDRRARCQQCKSPREDRLTLESSCCMYDHRYSILAPNGWTWRNVEMMPEFEKTNMGYY